MMKVYCDRCGRAETPLSFFKDIEIRGYWESPGRGKTFTVCWQCAKEFKKDFMAYRYIRSEAEGTAKAYMTEEGIPHPIPGMAPPVPPTKDEIRCGMDREG